MPASSASSAASVLGADTAASSGIPAIQAFWVSSKLARPETSSTWPVSGNRPSRSAQPITLSTALCRPTSSRSTSRSPAAENRPAACRPPVRSKVRWAARSRSGRSASVRAGTVSSSAETSNRDRVRTASMLAFPQTPQEEVV
jgi:hypothetical protein